MGLADALAKHGFKNAEQQEVTAWLSTGNPVLDHRLSGRYIGGGFACGRVHEVAGPSSAGKTAIATNVMIGCQKQGGVSIFVDHEKSFDVGLAQSLGLNTDPDHWIYDTPKTYEESWDKVKGILYVARGIDVNKDGVLKFGNPIIPYEKPIVVVFDSLASMTPQQKFAKAAEDQGMNDHLALAKLTSQTFDVMATIAEATNTTFIFLNQVRMKPGVMYGDPTTTPGGNAPEFYCSTRLRLGKSILYDEKTKTKYGTKIGCEVIKNKTWRPFGKTEWEFHFQPDGTGKFDVTGAVIEELKTLGRLETAGAYIVWEGKKYYKSQLVPYIDENGLLPKLIELFPRDEDDLTA